MPNPSEVSSQVSQATQKLELAQHHLERVQFAWDEPTDWADLSLYGFYALEAAVDAACFHLGIAVAKTHPSRADTATRMATQHRLPDVSDLLRELNDARKSVAYGDIELPELDPEETAIEIETFIDAVGEMIGGGDT